jgi:hypothetical protein
MTTPKPTNLTDESQSLDQIEPKVGPSPLGSITVAAPSAGIPGSAAWFDTYYRSAGGDMSHLPWADGAPNPALVSWLNSEAPGRVRPGSRAVVIGSGLGDDVIELINRGYDALGFDVSSTAVEWARRRFPAHASAFCVSDLLAMPTKFRHRFELVVECYTIQSLDPADREAACAAIAGLCCPRGVIVTIARGRDDAQLLETVQGPPWPLTRSELTGLFEAQGFKPVRPIDDFFEDDTSGSRRLRGVFERA